MLCRHADWQTRLGVYLERRKRAEFLYGEFDCCLFVCDAILAINGTDVAEPFRDQYNTRKEAFRAMRKYAGAASVQAVTERITSDHQMLEIRPILAQRGDVVLIKQHYYALALVGLDGALLSAAAQGFERVPQTLAVRAWRV